MRYILLVFFAFITAYASAQVQFLGSPTTTVRNRGNFVSDSLFYLPKRTKAPSDSGALRYQISDSALYVWTGSQWIKAGGGAGSITGTLTTNYLPKATGSTTLGNSIMYDSTGHVRAYGNWIGNGNSSRFLFSSEVDGQNGYPVMFRQNDSLDNNIQYVLSLRKGMMTSSKPRPGFGAGYDVRLPDDTGAFRRIGAILHRLSDTTAAGLSSYMQFQVAKGGTIVNPLQIYSDSSIRMAKLAGSGTRYVVADANGDLTATSATTSTIGGSGTTNYIPKFTASTTLGNSLIYDNGTSVGIGTTSPSRNFDIVLNTNTSAGSRISNISTGTSAATSTLYSNGSLNHEFGILGQSYAGYGVLTANSAFIYTTGGGNIQLAADGGGYIALGTGSGNPERMRMTSAGELLIGTTSDAGAYALQVAGSIYNTTGAVLAASSGNVGIGTTSPASTLHIAKAGNDLITLERTNKSTGSGKFGINVESNSQTTISYDNASPLVIGTATNPSDGTGFTERMRITSAGELLIGTTTDAGAYVLQASGAVYTTSSITTGAPSGGTAKPFKIGAAATVSPTSPNRTIEIEIDGTTYYLHAKTTNN